MSEAEIIWREACHAVIAACLSGAPRGVINQYAVAMFALHWDARRADAFGRSHQQDARKIA